MLDAASPSQSIALQSEKLVVLILPELLDGLPKLADLHATFAGPVRRVLLCFAERADPALLARLNESKIETQILLGSNVDLPEVKGAIVLKAPPATSPAQLNEFALALSDVVLVGTAMQKAPANDQIAKLIEQIGVLKKPMLAAGAPLPTLPPTVSVTKRLDPLTPGIQYKAARILCGRTEQAATAVLNFWGVTWESKARPQENLHDVLTCWFKSLRLGLRCWGAPFSLRAYFAPDRWTELLPDRRGRSPAAPIVVGFESFDRTALFGAHVHRDLTWVIHLCAALAVICALGAQFSWRSMVTSNGVPCEGEVAVQLACPVSPNRSAPPEAPPNTSTPEPAKSPANVPPKQSSGSSVTIALPQDVRATHYWLNIGELILLASVVLTWVFLNRTSLQDRWMASRLGAEQLRIARMSLPLLVLPPALATSEDVAIDDKSRSAETQLSFRALAEVKRIVREQGLPQCDRDWSIERAIEWLRLIVEDQRLYHADNFRKLEQTKNGLERLTFVIFAGAAAGVLGHLYNHQDVWLFATAGLPALGAALHGAGTRLGIVHRAALSNDAAKELAGLAHDLDRLGKSTLSDEVRWAELRSLTESAAEVMGRENSSWHGLVSRYTDELPA